MSSYTEHYGRGDSLYFANPANGGEGFANARNQGTIKRSTNNGETWDSSLHVTPLGLSNRDGGSLILGSYDYSFFIYDCSLLKMRASILLCMLVRKRKTTMYAGSHNCLVPTPMNDDKTQGGLLCSHSSASAECNENPSPPSCWLTLFSRFPLELDF